MDNTLNIQDKFKNSPLKSAVIIKTGPDGLTTSTVIFRREGTRKVSKRWRSVDKLLRRLSQAQQATANEFAALHERSRAKKKDGGVRDLVKNISKASRKGRKKLKITFL
jgi:hypothetical protein